MCRHSPSNTISLTFLLSIQTTVSFLIGMNVTIEKCLQQESGSKQSHVFVRWKSQGIMKITGRWNTGINDMKKKNHTSGSWDMEPSDI